MHTRHFNEYYKGYSYNECVLILKLNFSTLLISKRTAFNVKRDERHHLPHYKEITGVVELRDLPHYDIKTIRSEI